MCLHLCVCTCVHSYVHNYASTDVGFLSLSAPIGAAMQVLTWAHDVTRDLPSEVLDRSAVVSVDACGLRGPVLTLHMMVPELERKRLMLKIQVSSKLYANVAMLMWRYEGAS